MNNNYTTKSDYNVNNELSVKQLMKKFEISNSHKSTMLKSTVAKTSPKRSPYFGTLKPCTVVSATTNETIEHNINIDSKVSSIPSKPLHEVIKIFGEPARLSKAHYKNISDNIDLGSVAKTKSRKIAPPVAPKPKLSGRQPSTSQTSLNPIDLNIEPPNQTENAIKTSVDSIHSIKSKSESADEPLTDAYVCKSHESHSNGTSISTKDEAEQIKSASSFSREPTFSTDSSNEHIKIEAAYAINDSEHNLFDESSLNQEIDTFNDSKEDPNDATLYSDLIPDSYNATRDDEGKLVITLPEPTNKSSIFVPKPIKKCVTFTDDSHKVLETYNEVEYERGDPDVDPVTASAEYELEKAVEKLTFINVEIAKDAKGLGLSIVGKGLGTVENNERLGIFVKSLTPGGAAENSGMVQVNDQIIEVNGINLVGVSQQVATQSLRNTSTVVKFIFGRKIETED